MAQILDLRMNVVDSLHMALRLIHHTPQPIELVRGDVTVPLLAGGYAVTVASPSVSRCLVLSDCGRITLETLERRLQRHG
jgi:hypothetical protein